MALHFGFGLYGYGGDKAKEYWDKKFQALSDDMKEFYHNTLPWLCMSHDIGFISERTVDEILHREFDLPWGILIKKNIPGETKEEKKEHIRQMLIQCIGFQTNVGTLSIREYIKKRTHWEVNKSRLKGKADVNKEREKFKKEMQKEVEGDGKA